MSRTFKDDPLWVRENRSPTRTRHQHWMYACDDPELFFSGSEIRGRVCSRMQVLKERGWMRVLKNSRFYDRDRRTPALLQALVEEWNSTGECDDSDVSRLSKNTSIFKSGWYDL